MLRYIIHDCIVIHTRLLANNFIHMDVFKILPKIEYRNKECKQKENKSIIWRLCYSYSSEVVGVNNKEGTILIGV